MEDKRSKTVKQPITDQKKKSRLASLEAGRKKRMKSLQNKTTRKAEDEGQKFDLSSQEIESGSCSSDDDAFVITRKTQESGKASDRR